MSEVGIFLFFWQGERSGVALNLIDKNNTSSNWHRLRLGPVCGMGNRFGFQL